ncbi:hypothetical protein PUN28_004431 [Cardiocondyla obscurior]|uniref:Uncharacterized protein n=1 Tax=Cardiocondyla obscurior TaxID=286306 RepID=A0AAW2GGV7_9HYME
MVAQSEKCMAKIEEVTCTYQREKGKETDFAHFFREKYSSEKDKVQGIRRRKDKEEINKYKSRTQWSESKERSKRKEKKNEEARRNLIESIL